MRMEVDKLPKVLLNYKPGDRRGRGKPWTRWEDSLDVGMGQ